MKLTEKITSCRQKEADKLTLILVKSIFFDLLLDKVMTY